MAAKKASPYGGAVAAARQQARASGARPPQVRQAAQQARQTYRQNQQTPQPPPQQAPQGQGGYFQYSPTAESQINQPYQDLSAAGAYGALGGALGAIPGQQQMAQNYGQGAAANLGGAQQAMGPLAQLGGQYAGVSGQNLGNYGQLLGGNQNIQRGLANEIQGIQAGNLDVDPALVQMYGQQQRDLNSQLQRQLGPDYATSSAGIEAQGRFQQGRDTALASANYNRLLGLIGAQQGGMQNLGNAGLGFGQFGSGIQGQQFGQGAQLGAMFGNQTGQNFDQAAALRNLQLGGAGQMLGQLGQIQGLYGNIPTTMGQFGQAMTGQAGAAVNAQGPYQQDRLAQLGAMYAPTAGQYLGQMMGQSGNRWASIGGNMMGGGGGAGGIPTNPYG